ncbi:MAG: alpha-glucosidase [Lachnospiraceae bacterium]|nr:alpha-glucosidase [Lachnospiraceae bacterium]
MRPAARKGGIDIIDWHDISLEVGNGENRFVMKRGSFKYKQKINWRTKCVQTAKSDKPEGCELTYTEAHSGSEIRILLTEKDGRTELVCTPSKEAVASGINRYYLTLSKDPAEHIYGLGETYSEFDLSGQKVRIWVAEHQNTSRISKKIIKEKLFGKRPDNKLPFGKYESYYVQPTFTSSDRYYVHADVCTYSEFDLTRPDRITIYTQEPPKIISETGKDFKEVSEKLTALLGRQTKLPDWIYEGGILAIQDWVRDGDSVKEGMDGCGNIDRKLERIEKYGGKVSGVWCQDWCGCRCTGFGYQVMWNWVYSKEQYAGLPEKISEWKAKGVRFLGYINPFLALEKEIYAEAAKKGYCVKNDKGEDYLVTITTFPAAMIDLTNPKAYDWYKELIKKNMIGIGMGGWMADFGEYLPTDAVLYNGDPKSLHNKWPAMWAKLNREAIEECGVSDEVFFFTRAGFTGTVAASTMMWTGDQHVDWSVDDGIGSVIPATLSLAMSGYGIAHSDAGGYTTIMHMRRSKELLMRWEEMNVFSPLWRTHEGNQPGNNIQFDCDEETLSHTAHCLKLHAGLGKYIKALVQEETEHGTPVMRPVFYHYDEPWAYTETTEYLLGEDILVAPILKEGATERPVKLPEGRWVHLFTGREYGKGTFEIGSPIGEPPVFIRKGSPVFEELMSIIK